MRHRAIRTATAILCILQVSGLTVNAGPVIINQVVQVIGSADNRISLRLKNSYESSEAVAAGVSTAPNSNANVTRSVNSHSVDIPNTPALLVQDPSPQKPPLNIVDRDDVEGTICDCGEILVAGGFPKWPLLFLAAIPLFLIGSGGSEVVPPGPPVPNATPTPTPTPTPPVPTPSPVPEPATLLLFGTSLVLSAAFFRRRKQKRLELLSSGKNVPC